MPYEVVSLSFHPFGMALAVGSTEGHLIVLNAETSATVASVRVCGSPLSCLSYNPAGDVIAVGSQNGSVYLFRVSRDGYSYKRAHKIRGSQPLTQLDWSTDGGFLQTATEDYDLTFCKLCASAPVAPAYSCPSLCDVAVVVRRGREGAVRGEEPRCYEGR